MAGVIIHPCYTGRETGSEGATGHSATPRTWDLCSQVFMSTSHMYVGWSLPDQSVVCLSLSAESAGEEPSAVQRLGSFSEPGQTKGPGPSCCHAAHCRLWRAGLMEQQSLHRGISSICVLTWDVRNVRQPQQLCACQGRWQGGAGGRPSKPSWTPEITRQQLFPSL